MKDMEKQLKALANGRRLAILLHLRKANESSVGEIATAIKLSFKSTSRHLGILYTAGMIEREQRNTEVFYRLTTPSRPIVKAVLNLI